MNFLNQLQNKILLPKEVDQTISKLKSNGQSIVFTNGCFDILHKGHVEYLAEAANLGDVLIVGINTNESVKRLGKGDARPVNDLDARATVLAALGFVGFVTSFNDDTPLDLITQIRPDFLVKGADYDPNETNPTTKTYVVGREIVLKNGGEVKVIDLRPGFSTTNIINKLQK